ncbi:hypothetical protein LEP1GSC193_0716 [Leptospira phage vB_LalZ_80412-LE1]|uniref:Uncharacterized protein n=1 Tax=Leptospira alstonii serovar Sichuan str. 79601 TaxID=1218565 RepID=M6D2T9_9LEPT|nr:hypothetical protein LEP1GSC193_0716 [Leptospira phage vB_LalZ_80412-LE1]EMJ95508.1 hypothetical protein LEP1GSC194_3517 [Leptospira alstonii serovar Sichuan str. 79601]
MAKREFDRRLKKGEKRLKKKKNLTKKAGKNKKNPASF